MPSSCNCCAGPTPDKSIMCGEPIEPAARMTSPRQRAIRACPPCVQRTPAAHRLEEGAGRRPAPAALLVDVEGADAFVVAAVEVGNGFDAGLFGGSAEGIEQIPAHPRRRDVPFAADRMRLARAEEMIFVALEIRQYVIPAPAAQAELPPVIVIGGLAAHIDHGVDRRRAADHLAARIIEAAAVEALFGLGLKTPVGARIADGEQIADRNVKPDPVVAAAGFEN